ncbi:MAG TPA: chemotaxis protein CheX [Nocardioides sp.]|nr:chemotaxis protein CheX [Nocardioides sp.]
MTAGTVSPTTGEELAALVEEIWVSLLSDSEPLVPMYDAEAAAPLTDPWSAQVTIDGDWHGTVRVDLDAPLAEALTARMLGRRPGAPLVEGALEDAVGELANVIGGNVKSLLPGEGSLSLPVAGRPLPAASGETVCRTDHSWDEHRLSVLVLTPAEPHQTREPR